MSGARAGDSVFHDLAHRVGDDPESCSYLRAHRLRYGILLDLVGAIVTQGRGKTRILDVGPSYESEMMRRLWPDAQIDSLGFEDARLMSPRAGERHIEFDLANTVDETDWPAAGPYDLIVLAEVVEHLYTSPAQTLRMIASLLRPGGKVIIQTPNAAAMSRRFWLLMGRNPFEPIRDDLHQAGHFREYTAAELRHLCEQAHLRVLRVEMQNYFLTGSRKNRLLVKLGPAIPPTLRQGITLVAESVS
jgi:trans-aconitate methyltransferase